MLSNDLLSTFPNQCLFHYLGNMNPGNYVFSVMLYTMSRKRHCIQSKVEQYNNSSSKFECIALCYMHTGTIHVTPVSTELFEVK